MREIKLLDGSHTQVDDCDYALCMNALAPNNHWSNAKGRPYAACIVNGIKRPLYIYQVILGKYEGEVDHIDKNKLNNQRSNLRICTRSENSRNQPKYKTSNKYKGVSLRFGNRYRAKIIINRQGLVIGTFDTEEEAACAYDIHALYYFKEFACLNFPDKLKLYLSEIEANRNEIPLKYKGKFKSGYWGRKDKQSIVKK